MVNSQLSPLGDILGGALCQRTTYEQTVTSDREDFPRGAWFILRPYGSTCMCFELCESARVGEPLDSILRSLKCFDIHPSIHGNGFIILSDHEEAHA